MSWTERLNDVLPRVRLGTAVVDIHEWAHSDQPMDSPPHRHSYFVVCRVEAGEGEFTAAGRFHHVGPGDLLIARPGVRHRTVGAQGFRIAWVAFEVSPGTLGGEDAGLVLQGFLAAHSAVVRDAGPAGALWEMLKEAARGPRTPGQAATLAALAPALLVSLARAGGGDAKTRSRWERAGSGAAPDRKAGSAAGNGAVSDGEGDDRDGRDRDGRDRDGDRDGRDRDGRDRDGRDRDGRDRDGRDGDGEGQGRDVDVEGDGDGDGVSEGLEHGDDGEAPAPERHLRAVRMAVRYIEDNLDRPLRVEELAKQVNVSPRQLTRLFATVLNEPPASYVERVRLERAAGLLARTQKPIKQIAAELGYPDVPTFTRAFARQHQSPPGRFRRANVNGDQG